MDQDKKKTRRNESSFLNFDPQEYFGSAVDQKIEELKEEAQAEENKELGMQIINEALKFCWVPLLIWPCWNLALVPLFGLPTIGFFKSIAIYLIIKIVKL